MTPNQMQELAVVILRIYQDAETEVFSEVARRIADGIEEEGWAEQKANEIRVHRRRMQQIVRELEEAGINEAEELLEEAMGAGQSEAVNEIAKHIGEEAVKKTFNKTNRRAVFMIASEHLRLLRSTHTRILRHSEDIYRQVIARATGPAVAGAMTRRKAAQSALNQFANEGISGFVDSAGRNWEMASYAEMATRTALRNTMVEAHSATLQENGFDLVIISDSPDECHLCRPHEGKVYSLSGQSEKYPPLSKAISEGLFHNNCTHREHLYIPGVTKPMRDTSNAEGNRKRKHQRYLERGIRQWKRREVVAITDEDKQYAKEKRREWQARAREFVKETDRRRRYDREQINKAR